MLGYNDILVYACGKVPVEHTKHDKVFSQHYLSEINKALNLVVGSNALFFYTDGKKYSPPKIVTIISASSEGAMMSYKCYDAMGRPRQDLRLYVSNSEIYCRDAKLCVIDTI